MGNICSTDQLRKSAPGTDAFDISQKWTADSQQLNIKFQDAETTLHTLRQAAAVKEHLCSVLQQEAKSAKSELRQVKNSLDQATARCAELESQDKLLNLKLQVAEAKLHTMTQTSVTQDQICANLQLENRQLQSRVLDLISQLYSLQEVSKFTNNLIAVSNNEVKDFDPANNRWNQLLSLREDIQVSCNSSSTFLNQHRIFVCGGGYPDACICHIGKCAYLLETDGTVQQLSDMAIGRATPGVIWDRAAEAVYVFGGASNCGKRYTELLKSCEQFKSSQWLPLPDMHTARSAFNPCWHSSVVYLCGGRSASVETYDPRSNNFTLLQELTLPESNECTAVVDYGVLTVIGWNYISWLQEDRFSSKPHPEYRSWSNCTPVASGELIFTLSLFDHVCRGVSFRTGVVAMEVRI